MALAGRGRIELVGEIMGIALDELRVPLVWTHIDGPLPEMEGYWFRRCIREAQAERDPRISPDEEESDTDADQYVMIYRECDHMDLVEKTSTDDNCFRVEYILHNRELAGQFVIPEIYPRGTP